MSELSDKLRVVVHLLRLLDVEIEKQLSPHLRDVPFNPETQSLGIVYVRPYTLDLKAALTLPGSDPTLRSAVEIVIAWLRKEGL